MRYQKLTRFEYKVEKIIFNKLIERQCTKEFIIVFIVDDDNSYSFIYLLKKNTMTKEFDGKIFESYQFY